jgi:hypothetical protein
MLLMPLFIYLIFPCDPKIGVFTIFEEERLGSNDLTSIKVPQNEHLCDKLSSL